MTALTTEILRLDQQKMEQGRRANGGQRASEESRHCHQWHGKTKPSHRHLQIPWTRQKDALVRSAYYYYMEVKH
jgi:hypothetical protein